MGQNNDDAVGEIVGYGVVLGYKSVSSSIVYEYEHGGFFPSVKKFLITRDIALHR